jgi:hypothetical protein
VEAQDPTYAALDQLLRIIFLESIRSCIWAFVFSAAYLIVQRVKK